jgi:hypothetical protein
VASVSTSFNFSQEKNQKRIKSILKPKNKGENKFFNYKPKLLFGVGTFTIL